MKFGVWLPNCRHLATPQIIRRAAVSAEELHYDSVWVSDHVAVPRANIPNFGETVFDPLITLGVVAGATTRVQLGTTVVASPVHNSVPPRAWHCVVLIVSRNSGTISTWRESAVAGWS